MDKVSLRTELLKKLSSLSNDKITELSLSLTHQLIKLLHSIPELADHVGAAYLPFRAEIAPVYQELMHKHPVDLAFPVLEKGAMAFGIPQGIPKGGTWMDPPYALVEPQWILVPGVAFDLEGARLGRGKGFYDRYLEDKPALRIGIAWSEQIVEKVPVESHDCHMDYLITESFCWNVSQQKRF